MKQLLNLVLLPNSSFKKKALKLAKKIGDKENLIFRIDGINFLPHISIKQQIYNPLNIDDIFKKITKLFKETEPLVLEFNKIYEIENYLMIGFKKSKKLVNLYESLNKIIGTKAETKNYSPHLTLVRLKNNKSAMKELKNIENKFSFLKTEVKKIALTEVGDNGTSTKIVREF